jgi:hypothetical protein
MEDVLLFGGHSNLCVLMFPWKYFFSTKQERSKEIKRELFT